MTRNLVFTQVLSLAVLAGLSGLAGCTLTSEDVEPVLPAVPVRNANTVAYQLNGAPVVAHNGGGTLFGRGNESVYAYFEPDSSLVIESVDQQNPSVAGTALHDLRWTLPRFQGVGRYQPVPAQTSFQLIFQEGPRRFDVPGPVQPLDVSRPAEIIVTSWDPSTQRVQGTFVLHFAARDGAPAAALSAGAFDLRLGR